MDFNQVRYFLALADTLNFTRAAEQCHVTQPALTQSIRRLEDELGGPLLHRNGRQTRLTELGRSLRGHFEQIDNTRRLVKSTARAANAGEQQELNIGLMCTIGPRVLTDFLRGFQAAHPQVMLLLHDVSPGSVAELLLSGAIDAAFCAWRGTPHPRLRHLPLYRERMVVAFPEGHIFAESDSVPLKEIIRQRYVDRLLCEYRDRLLDVCVAEGVALDIAFRGEREDWVQTAIRAGVGVAMTPEYSLVPPSLPYRRISDPGLVRTVELAVPDGVALSPAMTALLAMAEARDWPALAMEDETV